MLFTSGSRPPEVVLLRYLNFAITVIVDVLDENFKEKRLKLPWEKILYEVLSLQNKRSAGPRLIRRNSFKWKVTCNVAKETELQRRRGSQTLKFGLKQVAG